MNLNVYHKVYKENKVIPYKTFNIKVNKSYLTNKDYSGKVILNDKYYLVLNVNILNRSTINNKIKNRINFKYIFSLKTSTFTLFFLLHLFQVMYRLSNYLIKSNQH